MQFFNLPWILPTTVEERHLRAHLHLVGQSYFQLLQKSLY